MDIENVILNENSTLKPIPPKTLYCKTCRSDFISYLKMNAEFYKTCDECRHKIRLQGRKHRSTYKHILLN
jgi:DNA-directed RNA polymerase subunit RPC12/RpoP